jgi:hypothetical protein
VIVTFEPARSRTRQEKPVVVGTAVSTAVRSTPEPPATCGVMTTLGALEKAVGKVTLPVSWLAAVSAIEADPAWSLAAIRALAVDVAVVST